MTNTRSGDSGNRKMLIGMLMFNATDTYFLTDVIKHLRNYWGSKVDKIIDDIETATFDVDGESVAIAKIAAPIPNGDIESTARLTYLWKNVLENCKFHNSHAIVTIFSSSPNILNRYKIFTKVIASIFYTSGAIGIYQGSQSLLLPKSLYLEFANLLKDEQLPIQLWIYVGLLSNDNNKNSVYSYGLAEFDKKELEVIESKLTKSEIYDFITQIISYIIESNVVLKHGQTIGLTAEQKIEITSSKGVYVEGETLKLKL